MCWNCDHPGTTTDDYLAQVVTPIIARSGWFIQAVYGDKRHAPFAYTVGLTEHGLPELLVTGMAHYRSGHLLNRMAEHWLRTGSVPVHGQHVDTDEGCLEVVDLPRPDAHLVMAAALFGPEALRAQQLVWADSRRRWPWDRAFRSGRGGQPVLGPRAAALSGSCVRPGPRRPRDRAVRQDGSSPR